MANRGGFFYFRLLGGDDAVDGSVARGALGEMKWLRSTSPGWALQCDGPAKVWPSGPWSAAGNLR